MVHTNAKTIQGSRIPQRVCDSAAETASRTSRSKVRGKLKVLVTPRMPPRPLPLRVEGIGDLNGRDGIGGFNEKEKGRGRNEDRHSEWFTPLHRFECRLAHYDDVLQEQSDRIDLTVVNINLATARPTAFTQQSDSFSSDLEQRIRTALELGKSVIRRPLHPRYLTRSEEMIFETELSLISNVLTAVYEMEFKDGTKGYMVDRNRLKLVLGALRIRRDEAYESLSIACAKVPQYPIWGADGDTSDIWDFNELEILAACFRFEVNMFLAHLSEYHDFGHTGKARSRNIGRIINPQNALNLPASNAPSPAKVENASLRLSVRSKKTISTSQNQAYRSNTTCSVRCNELPQETIANPHIVIGRLNTSVRKLRPGSTSTPTTKQHTPGGLGERFNVIRTPTKDLYTSNSGNYHDHSINSKCVLREHDFLDPRHRTSRVTRNGGERANSKEGDNASTQPKMIVAQSLSKVTDRAKGQPNVNSIFKDPTVNWTSARLAKIHPATIIPAEALDSHSNHSDADGDVKNREQRDHYIPDPPRSPRVSRNGGEREYHRARNDLMEMAGHEELPLRYDVGEASCKINNPQEQQPHTNLGEQSEPITSRKEVLIVSQVATQAESKNTRSLGNRERKYLSKKSHVNSKNSLNRNLVLDELRAMEDYDNLYYGLESDDEINEHCEWDFDAPPRSNCDVQTIPESVEVIDSAELNSNLTSKLCSDSIQKDGMTYMPMGEFIRVLKPTIPLKPHTSTIMEM